MLRFRANYVRTNHSRGVVADWRLCVVSQCPERAVCTTCAVSTLWPSFGEVQNSPCPALLLQSSTGCVPARRLPRWCLPAFSNLQGRSATAAFGERPAKSDCPCPLLKPLVCAPNPASSVSHSLCCGMVRTASATSFLERRQRQYQHAGMQVCPVPLSACLQPIQHALLCICTAWANLVTSLHDSAAL